MLIGAEVEMGVGGIMRGVSGGFGVFSSPSASGSSVVLVKLRWPSDAERAERIGLEAVKLIEGGTARGVRRSSWRYAERGRDSVEFPGLANVRTDGSISCGLSDGWK